jgi:hypothetical protein
MAVETYIEDELQELVTDAEKTDEWRAKVEELGLTGQASLVDAKGEKSPVPFLPLTKGLNNMYQILCPTKIEVTEYRQSTMPSRVLEMIGLCVKEGYFTELQVWYDDQKPDPILVGVRDKVLYLIARWGDELRSFPELREIAKAKRIGEMKVRLERSLLTLETEVERYLNGDWVYFPV